MSPTLWNLLFSGEDGLTAKPLKVLQDFVMPSLEGLGTLVDG